MQYIIDITKFNYKGISAFHITKLRVITIQHAAPTLF